MPEITISERRRKVREAIAGAVNREEIERAIARLEARELPFEAYDLGGTLSEVEESYGDGILRWRHLEGNRTVVVGFASRLAEDEAQERPLIPRAQLPDLEPILEVGKGRGAPLILYVWDHKWPGGSHNVRWLLDVPLEMERQFPGRELTLSLQGCGSASLVFSRGGVTEKIKQSAYRCMERISKAFGGHRVLLRFEQPPKRKLESLGERG